jgi:hypothetical protein
MPNAHASILLNVRLSILALVASIVSLLTPLGAQAGKDDIDSFVEEVKSSNNPPDLDQLKLSHLSDLTQWQGVQPAARAKPEDGAPPISYGWRLAENGTIAPIAAPSAPPATTLVAVPEAGNYRIWVRYVAKPDIAQPFTLTLTGATEANHIYAASGLSGQDGKTQQEKKPIYFEAEFMRMVTPSHPLPIWEYWDIALKAGPTTLALTSTVPTVRADHLLITHSKTFRPSLITDPANATLNRTYYRFRVLEPHEGSDTHKISGTLTYHWGRPPPRPAPEPIWYYPFFDAGVVVDENGKKDIKTGEWSGFIDVTDGISSPGPWATASLGFSGINRGVVEAQLAWYPHPGAVLKTIRPRIESGGLTMLIPIDHRGYTCAIAGPNDKVGAWGMRTADYLSLLETPEDVNERHMAYAKAALAELPRQGNPAPKLIKLDTGNGAAASVRDAASQMLASLGINCIGGTSPAMRQKLGLRGDITLYANDALFTANSHDPTDPLIDATIQHHFEGVARSLEAGDPGAAARVTTLKMGDEIGAIVPPDRINNLPDASQIFHDYLRDELKAAGRDASFFGVKDVDELTFSPELPPDAGRYERRLYYHAAKFNFLFTARFYKHFTDAARKALPNVRTYCNFSPHPPMFGQNMNGSDWFALTRAGGATMGWAEDWAGIGGGWGFAGIQTVTYYAALVECAARKYNLPSGFYVVTTMGAADRKMFSLVEHGIFEQEVYSFGPRYAGAEFSNFWDERADAYKEIARGAFALGPADTIIAKGRRDPRKVGLLYNRSHEVWNGGAGGFQSDRLLTFIAIKHAHLPVDIIIEEDLAPETLKQYRVIYTQGYNLADRHVAALSQWVEAGGTLVGIAGTAMRDEYNDHSDAGETLFGATQRFAGASIGGTHPQSIPTHKPIDKIKIDASPLTPAMEADVVGVKTVLTPTTGKPVAHFADGSVAAVTRDLGKGKTLLWGVMPGTIYKGDAPGGNRYRLDRLPLVVQAATATLGRQRVEVSDPQVEVCFFEHESGLAVTMSEVAVVRKANVPVKDEHVAADAPAPIADGPLGDPPAASTITVSVQTDRPVKEVVTSYAGPVPWKREGDRIVVQVPLPRPVDVLILR